MPDDDCFQSKHVALKEIKCHVRWNSSVDCYCHVVGWLVNDELERL